MVGDPKINRTNRIWRETRANVAFAIGMVAAQLFVWFDWEWAGTAAVRCRFYIEWLDIE